MQEISCVYCLRAVLAYRVTRRRARAAGVVPNSGNHSFPAYLKNGGLLEKGSSNVQTVIIPVLKGGR
jgi:hypothetical protein